MVEMGMIDKEGFIGVPVLLGADHLAVASAIPLADREEKVSWTTAVLISSTL
jgi:hypothetical protein